MSEQEQADAQQEQPVTPPVQESQPASVPQATDTTVQPQQTAPDPNEPTWLLHYAGTEPLEKGGYTWQPDCTQRVPESRARQLVGSDNIRVVEDEAWFTASRAGRVNP